MEPRSLSLLDDCSLLLTRDWATVNLELDSGAPSHLFPTDLTDPIIHAH
jgi:hypothetical protein